MFWKFGGYGSISPIDAILDRPDFSLEELLDESDLLGDIKALNSKLLEYLRQRDVISSLLNLVVAPKLEPVVAPKDEEADKDTADAADSAVKPEDVAFDSPNSRSGRVRMLALGQGRSRSSSSATDGDFEEEDEAEKKRNKYAYVACEVLACDNWTISDALLDPENRDLLHTFWQFLKRPAPLDPLQAGYFTKVNESLFDKKVDEMVEFLKSADGAVQDMLRHVDSPMIMDLLLKIIILDRPEACQGIVEWLYTQDIIPTLLSFLSLENSWATQTSAGDFIKAIITVSANATQHEQTCIGPNELTRQLVSRPCIDELIGYMLKGGNALTVGVGIVIEVIRKNNSDYDPDVGTEANSLPSSRDPIYLGTLLRMFAQNVPNFMQLMSNTPAQKARLTSTFGEKIEPLGFDRFKTCELMAELLHCSNMGLLNEAGAEELIDARDAERNRLRSEGKLTPNRGEEAPPSSTDLLAMRLTHTSPADEGRRLEVTNSSAADDDGFEEVTHAAGLGEEPALGDHQLLPPAPILPSNGPASPSQPFIDKDEDDFVDEPLSSPRLKTHDGQVDTDNELPFDDPELLVAPLSPNKKRGPAAAAASTDTAEKEEANRSTDVTAKDELGEGAEDFVTEATEPALGDEAKRMVPDLERSDESDSSILFTPTISSLSESLDLPPPPHRAPSPPPEASQTMEKPPKAEGDEGDEKDEGGAGDKQNEAGKAKAEKPDLPAAESAETVPTGELPTTVQGDMDDTTTETPAIAQEDIALAEPESVTNEADAEVEDGSIIIATRPSAADATNESFATESRFSDPVVGDYLKMQFVDHRVIPNILFLFFSYPWNNFLHNVVYDVVQQVFNGPMERGFNPHLAVSLFESADITNQIINGQLVSEQSQAATRMRMGYMGHLTLIAEEVVKFTERNPPELLSELVLERVMSPDWIKYVEGPLAETRERDNAILGGVRPEVAMGNQAAAAGLAAVGLSGLSSSLGLSAGQGTSSALAEAGLNGTLDLHGDLDLQQGGHEGSLNPFSISAGISSGFHSSSDEEDDDAEDNDDEISNAFRAYTDPLSTSSSLLPPAIPPPPPPPPPPLNVPPSRARRQLAARLAMNKRNAEAAAAASAAGGQEDDAGAEDGGRVTNTDSNASAAADAASGDLSLRAAKPDGDGGSGGPVKTLAELLLQASQDSGRLRNPFADDDDDYDDECDERDEAEDEDDDEDNELYHANGEDDNGDMIGSDSRGTRGTGRGSGDDVSRVGLGWNRGSWWRSMVQRDRKNQVRDNRTTAGLNESGGGDGVSSDEDERTARDGGLDEAAANEAHDGETARHANHLGNAHDNKNENENENDDEEFGDFAMPESVATGAGDSAGPDGSSGSSGGEKVLIRPLALHPASSAKRNTDYSSVADGGDGDGSSSGGNNPGSGLWSFERFGFLAGAGAAKDGAPEAPKAAAVSDTAAPARTAASAAGTTNSSMFPADDELEVVLSEDGQRVARVTEAKRRTSLEDPDEDEVVV